MSLRKIGVEEELMLVDPTSGRLTAVSQSAVLANETDEEVEQELFLQQIETSTPPCERADDLLAGLRAGRRAVGEAAAAAGARAVAMPTPVLHEDTEDFTPKSRYRHIQAEYGEMARQALVCAMHMHVDVASEEEAVRVVDGIRPWLPPLVALAANSPYWQGRDTGHASWRSQVWSRWPTAGAAQPFGDLATYRAVSEQMLGWGAGLDAGMLYFDVRLSEAYPTVEIRVADVCTDVEDAARGRAARPVPGRDGRRRGGAADLACRPAAGRRLAGGAARDRRRPRAPGGRLHRVTTRRSSGPSWRSAATPWTSTVTSKS